MPRDTPYSGVAAMFRSSLERGEAPQVFEDGGQMRDFVHVADVARANVAALRAVVEAERRLVRRLQRRVRAAGLDPRRRRAGRAGDRSGIAPEVTGGYRLGDVRHIVASPGARRGRARLHGGGAAGGGLPEFATAPLRA